MRPRRLVDGPGLMIGLGLSLGLATGCERLLSIQDPIAGDASLARPDAPTDDATPTPDAPIMLTPGSPMLLSEVEVRTAGSEFIEIVNTSSDTVDLSTYYLSDTGNYFRLPVTATVDPTDFIVKFPDGALAIAHEVITVAIGSAAAFKAAYKDKAPDFSIADGTMKVLSASAATTLTDDGEPVILFQWDGHSDLVRDVDILIAGVPSAANPLTDKSGMAQDGPDPGNDTTAYAVDARTMLPQMSAPGVGLSTKRIALEAVGNEITRGGNGPDGQDETSEDTSLTWDGTTQNPFTAPTPGDVPQALLR